MKIQGVALAAALVLGSACAGPGAKDSAMEELAVRGASTPTEHRRLADYFRGQAEHARKEAKRHERMANFWRRHSDSIKTRAEMKQHCEKIESAQESLAVEYDQLARLQDQEAAEPPVP